MSFENFPKARQEFFSPEEREFLSNKLEEMHVGALSEEDFQFTYNSKGEKFGLYSKEEIEEDKKFVHDLLNDFELKNKKREIESTNESFEEQNKIKETSRYLEALFYEKLGGPHGWIPNATVWKTSEYDDLKNGVDFIVEVEKEQFGLAIDVTLSRRLEIIRDKLKKTKNLIDRDMLTEVKYYEHQGNNDYVSAVPLVIIVVDYDNAVQSLRFWADGEDELLSKHPTRVKAWLESSAQFEAFATYAKIKNKHELAEVYQRALSVISNIIEQNQEAVNRYKFMIEKDQAYQMIMSFCEEIKKEKLEEELV